MTERKCHHRKLSYRKCIDGHHLECPDCGMTWEWQGGPPGVLIARLMAWEDATKRIGRHALDIQRRMEFCGAEMEVVHQALAFVAEYDDIAETLEEYTPCTRQEVVDVLERHFGERWWENTRKEEGGSDGS